MWTGTSSANRGPPLIPMRLDRPLPPLARSLPEGRARQEMYSRAGKGWAKVCVTAATQHGGQGQISAI